MVVPLIFLGTLTKLAFAVGLTYRTKGWWLPGVIAIALGIAGWRGPVLTHTIGLASVVLGAGAFIVARHLRRRPIQAP